YQQRRVSRHATIQVRLPKDKKVKGEGEETYYPGGLIETSVGRVIFNDTLDSRMPFYNMALKSRDLANVISDCHLLLGQRPTIELLDKMKAIGFQESTLSGLSFGTSDLV